MLLNKLKPYAIHLALAGLVVIGGSAAAATFEAGPFNSQQPNVPTVSQEAAERGEGKPAPTEAAASINTEVPTNEPTSDTPTEVSGDSGSTAPNSGEPASITPDVPTSEPEAPAPTLVKVTMRFVDVSPAGQPNTKAAEYCDSHYSDGNVVPQWVATITNPAGFSQPIASYSATNPPNNYSPC